MRVTISAAVEGFTDEAAVRRLIEHAGAEPGVVYGKAGKSHLRERVAGYNLAARHAPWVVLVDLDQDADCAPSLAAAWLPAREPRLCLRVAVRAVESWLLADSRSLASFLSVTPNKIPADPDRLARPKEALVNLARSSRKKSIREDIVPREGSGRDVGPAYTSRLIEFVSSAWQPAKAAMRSESLRGAIACIERLANGGTGQGAPPVSP